MKNRQLGMYADPAELYMQMPTCRSPLCRHKLKQRQDTEIDRVIVSPRVQRSMSNKLMLNVVIDEALKIKKRVEQIQAFNEYCQKRRKKGKKREQGHSESNCVISSDIDTLSRKLDNMQAILEQQRTKNQVLREKLQSQQFESRSVSRQAGKFKKPLSRGMVSTQRDTDHLTSSRLSDQLYETGNFRGKQVLVGVRNSVDQKVRKNIPKGGLTDRPNQQRHEQQLQLLNEQFEQLILKQDTVATKDQRNEIRNQLIDVSRRINELTNYKMRTYHL